MRSVAPDRRDGGRSSGSLAKPSLPHPMDTIAELELLEVAPSGRRSPVRVQVGRPRRFERGGWACPVLITTIDERVRDIYGEDSMQALCLAVRFVHRMLHSVVERGCRLVDPQEGSDFPLEAYFGNVGLGTAPNHGPATPLENSGTTEGPSSVS